MVNVEDVHEFEGDVGGQYALKYRDHLKAIFARQSDLMGKYGPIEARNLGQGVPPEGSPLDDRRQQVRVKDLMWRVTEELGEAANCLKNKPWKNTHTKTDEAHFFEELSDAFHFFIELCIQTGMNEEDLYRIYMDKSAVNSFRQRSNY